VPYNRAEALLKYKKTKPTKWSYLAIQLDVKIRDEKSSRRPWRTWISINDEIDAVQCNTVIKRLDKHRYGTLDKLSWDSTRFSDMNR
jgi:hypothetical protein